MRLLEQHTPVARSGMTLIELMIALVITGMALAAGYAALSTVIDRRMQADIAVAKILRASTVRRTIVTWLEQGQLQLATGGAAVPQDFSGLGETSDELRFVTTASTPLQRDSTVVQMYVNTSTDYSALGGSTMPPGLVAMLTPTTSALSSMESASEGMAGSEFPSSSSGGTDAFGSNSSGSYYADGSRIVSLDSTVTAMHVDYLTSGQGGTQVWIPSSTWSTTNGGGGGTGGGGTILAVRITFQSTPPMVLSPMLGMPIIVP